MTNYLSFNKILYHPHHMLALQEDKAIFPLHATVSLGNFCNHKCLWCTAFEYQKEKATLMDSDALLVFLKQAKARGLKAVTYVGNGEPTVHPKFKELISEVHALGLEQGMFTNGYLLERYEADILKFFTWVRVSLDAGSQEMHAKMHDVKNHFDTIMANVQNLILKRGTNPQPTIGVQYALHHENISDLYRAAALCKELHVDYFSIKPVFNRGSVGERIAKNTLSHEQIEMVVDKIKDELEMPEFKVFYRPHQLLSHAQEKTIFSYERCVAGFFNINVYEDNRIIYCGPHRISVGKLTDTVETIEANIYALSKQLNLSKCPAGCRYHELNHLVHPLLSQENFYASWHLNFI